MRKEFKTKLVSRRKSGDVAGVVVPFDVKQVWGSARVPVKGSINGTAEFRTTVVRMDGEYCFCVNQKMRQAAGGVGPGDTVKVVLKPDTAPRTVEVPPDLKKALKSNQAAQAAWERYSYTHRKEFAQWITEAKKPETRARRLEKAVEMLAAGRNLSERYSGLEINVVDKRNPRSLDSGFPRTTTPARKSGVLGTPVKRAGALPRSG